MFIVDSDAHGNAVRSGCLRAVDLMLLGPQVSFAKWRACQIRMAGAKPSGFSRDLFSDFLSKQFNHFICCGNAAVIA